MIICNSKKFIYIHIPKCGGTSVSSFLERRLLPQDITLNLSQHEGWGRYIEAVRIRHDLVKHSTAMQIRKAVRPEHFSNYYVFTFCRNPFARAYSAFKFTKRVDAIRRPDSQRYQDIKDMSFEEFLASPYMQEQNIFQARPQSLWVQGVPEKVHVFKLENIDQALSNLSKRLYGEEDQRPVPRKNFSADENEWKKMSPQAEDMVRDLYSGDFERFDYPLTIER